MRKLLLASAALLGATSGLAMAQMAPAPLAPIPNPAQGQTPSAPASTSSGANNVNNYVGQPDTFQGVSQRFTGAVATPTPGTLVIKLNGKVEVDMNAAFSTVNNSYTPGAKVNPISFGTFMRLYPGVDGMAANGLRYGASIELRENFPGSGAQPTPALSPAPSGSSYSSGETVFVRRAFTYMAADNVGMVRFGQTDGVIGMFDPCIYSAQCWDAGIGNFNGGQIQAQSPGGAVGIPFVWLAQAGAEYGNSKVVYMSPQFFGFDFGVQYAPGENNGYSACGTGTQAATSCATTTTGTDPTRWYNQVAAGVRYQGVFGPVIVGAYAMFETAGKEDFFGPAVANGGPEHVSGNEYDNLSFGEYAGYIGTDTPIGRFVYSADYIGGALNGQLSMRPTGGASEQGFVTGILYNNGPLTLGAETAIVNSQGSANLVGISQRREYEVAFGGNYNLAPGLFLVGEFMYEHRHQGDFNFATNAPNTGTNDAQARGVLFSTVVNW
jgi:predicted porin